MMPSIDALMLAAWGGVANGSEESIINRHCPTPRLSSAVIVAVLRMIIIDH